MRLRIGAFICVFILAGAVTLAAQGKVCSLLTTAEVTAALGSARAGIEGEMPVPGAPAGATMKTCSWPLAARGGGMYLSVTRMDPRVSFDSLVAMSFQTYDQLKAKGWTEDKKNFGGVKCLSVKPPAGDASAPLTTACMAQVKGMFLGATTMTKTPVPMDTVNTLMASAAGRLP